MGWTDEPMVAFDVETTGVDIEQDRIVTAAVAKVGAGVEPFRWSWLIDPGVPIPEEATKVHGISTGRAQAEGIPAAEAIAQIVDALAGAVEAGEPVVAFNARFDLTILDREARRHGVVPLCDRPGTLRVLDPYVMDKHVDRYRRGSRKLDAMCAHYGAKLDVAHEAAADAIAAARVAWRIGTKTDLGLMSLPVLMVQQTVWAQEQAAGLEAYFRKQGKDERVEGEWPMVTLVPEAVAS